MKKVKEELIGWGSDTYEWRITACGKFFVAELQIGIYHVKTTQEMAAHEKSLSGTWMQIIDPKTGKPTKSKPPTKSAWISNALLKEAERINNRRNQDAGLKFDPL